MQPHIQDVIQGIRDQLDKADQYTKPGSVSLGMTMVALGQLLDVTERLYKRIVELERVQNERAD